MKRNFKVMLFTIVIILICITKSFAYPIDYAINPDTFKPSYNTDISEVESLGEKIYGYIVNIAAVSSVAIIAYFGLKFMLGSVDQKAEYKKSFMPLIVGMFIVLGASTIMGATWKLMPKKKYSSQNGGTHKCAKYIQCEGGFCPVCGEWYEALGHSYVKDENTPVLEVCEICGDRRMNW